MNQSSEAGIQESQTYNGQGSPVDSSGQTTDAEQVLSGVVEHESNEQTDEVADVDYTTWTKSDFAQQLKELAQENDVKRADRLARQMRAALDDLREQERNLALARFVESGGKQEDFSWKSDDSDLVIDGALRLIREKKQRNIREQEEQRKQNLSRKLALLERLREVVEVQNAKKGFEEFKKIQAEWNAAGPVPQAENEKLWASYHALVDRFFDQRHIYFELLDLDRRKNSEAKQDICLRAEKLLEVGALHVALRELNELHQEWKRVGPVVREEKETLWNRFKAASDTLYRRRDEHDKEVSQRHKANQAVRQDILTKLETLAVFESDSIKEWNARSQEISAIKQEWEAAGPVDREQGRKMNKQFWTLFKKFFNQKGKFFRQLDAGRQENLDKKRALVERVKQLQESDAWEQAAEEIKQLQRDWKEIGPVPDKFRNSIFDEFRAACDHFFNRRRGVQEESEKAMEENLVAKEAVCAALEALRGGESAAVEEARRLIEQFHASGMVPRKALGTIRERQETAMNTWLETIEDVAVREKIRFDLSMAGMKNDPGASRQLIQQEQQVRRKLNQAEDEVAVLRNNMGFFARSKNADSVRADFDYRIKAAEAQVAELKARLKLIRSQLSSMQA